MRKTRAIVFSAQSVRAACESGAKKCSPLTGANERRISFFHLFTVQNLYSLLFVPYNYTKASNFRSDQNEQTTRRLTHIFAISSLSPAHAKESKLERVAFPVCSKGSRFSFLEFSFQFSLLSSRTSSRIRRNLLLLTRPDQKEMC